MKVAKIKKTSLLAPLSSSDTTVLLKHFTDHKGNTVDLTAFEDYVVIVVRQGEDVEMILCDGITQNANGSATLDIATDGRHLDGTYPYAGYSTGLDFNSGAEVIVSDDPYTVYAITQAYADGLAFAGAPNGSTTVKGLFEGATLAQVRARTATGETGAALVATPDVLDDLPSQAEKTFLGSITGIIFPYGGASAPSGFLLCDGTAYNNDDYLALAGVIRNHHGNNTGATLTVDAGTDVITASTHGLSDGDAIFFTTTTTLPGGISANTLYYVRDATTHTFKVATSVGGAAVDITSAGTGTHSFHTQFKVPDLRGSIPLGAGQRVRTITFDGATDVEPSTDVITVASNDWLYTGQAVVLSGAGLPTGLSATTYYVIRLTATTIKLATSVANANAGLAVDITVDGSGTCTLTQTLTSRTLGSTGGEETHALTDAEMPSHSHTVSGTSSGSGAAGGGSLISATVSTSTEGSDTVHNNMPPYAVVNYIIKT